MYSCVPPLLPPASQHHPEGHCCSTYVITHCEGKWVSLSLSGAVTMVAMATELLQQQRSQHTVVRHSLCLLPTCGPLAAHRLQDGDLMRPRRPSGRSTPAPEEATLPLQRAHMFSRVLLSPFQASIYPSLAPQPRQHVCTSSQSEGGVLTTVTRWRPDTLLCSGCTCSCGRASRSRAACPPSMGS